MHVCGCAYIHKYLYVYTQVRLKTFLSLALLCERASIIPAHATTEYLRHHAGLTLMRLADMALRSINDHDKVRLRPTLYVVATLH